MRRGVWIVTALVVTTVAGGVPASAAGATRYVATTGQDTGDCEVAASPCRTLTYALSRAHDDDTVRMAPGTYRDRGLDLAFSVAIVGSGARTTVLDGGGADRFFTIEAGATVAVDGLTLVDGRTGDHGGAIVNSGTLSLEGDSFVHNEAADPGGAITNYGSIPRIDRTWFVGNRTSRTGGAIVTFGTVGTIDRSVFAGNAAGLSGGAISADGDIRSIARSTFRGNVGTEAGGALDIGFGTVGAVDSDTFAGNSTRQFGGAIDLAFATVSLLSNDTFSGNASTTPTGGGGAIFVDESRIRALVDSTVVGNSTMVFGGGLEVETGSIVGGVSGTLFAGNVSGTGEGNCYVFNGGIRDRGHNLEDDAAGVCGFSPDRQDLVGVSPELRRLGRYGGPTATMPPVPDSPAIDAGGPGPCPAPRDQRGIVRPQGAACDIGAVEAITS